MSDSICGELAREVEGDDAVEHTSVVTCGPEEVVVEPGTSGMEGVTAPSWVELDRAAVVSLAVVVDRVGVEDVVSSGEP